MTAPSAALVRDAYRAEARARLLRYARVALIGLGVLPWVVPFVRALGAGAVGDVLDGLFVAACHRLPARTLALAGVAMPLCSRCAGVFAGLALGAVLARPVRLGRARAGVLVASVLLAADVAAQDLGVHPFWHASRVITGALLGACAATAALAAVRGDQ